MSAKLGEVPHDFCCRKKSRPFRLPLMKALGEINQRKRGSENGDIY